VAAEDSIGTEVAAIINKLSIPWTLPTHRRLTLPLAPRTQESQEQTIVGVVAEATVVTIHMLAVRGLCEPVDLLPPSSYNLPSRVGKKRTGATYLLEKIKATTNPGGVTCISAGFFFSIS
jgi:hypothetical protein